MYEPPNNQWSPDERSCRTERSHISALERAEKGPSLGTILRLAQALGMPAGEVVSRVEQKLAEKRR